MRLDDDPRWQRFNDASRVCSCCGKSHSGVFAIVQFAPNFWPHEIRELYGDETIEVGDDILGTDICRVGDDCAIRCTMPFPILGTDVEFSFGIWVSAAQSSVNSYIDAWQSADYSDFPGWAGWLCNDLPTFEFAKPTLGDAYTGGIGNRPRYFVRE
ncbi:MAG: DUF2199 domain-containing protein, partial [Deltaproteobacteria bacterium]